MLEVNTFEQEFVPPARAWALLALFAICFALYGVVTYLLPHDPYIRYQQMVDSDFFRGRWVYERIHYDRTPIDVAIIGSSRVEAAVSAPDLEKALTDSLGRPIHVANLAVPLEGRNAHYLLARDLMESRRETRIILVSVVERPDLSHPAFRYLADPIDLLGAPLFLNHYYFLDAAFLPYRQMSYFIQTQFPGLFGVSRSFRSDYMGTDFDTTYSFRLPSGKLVDRFYTMPEERLNAGAQNTRGELGDAWRPSRWHALNNPLEAAYTERLVDVARSHCVETIFVRLPFYGSRPHLYDEALYRGLGPLLDAEQLAGDPHDFGDGGHFNRNGTNKVSSWLRDAIGPYLAPLKDPAACPK
jgi:hypothetical protein